MIKQRKTSYGLVLSIEVIEGKLNIDKVVIGNTEIESQGSIVTKNESLVLRLDNNISK